MRGTQEASPAPAKPDAARQSPTPPVSGNDITQRVRLGPQPTGSSRPAATRPASPNNPQGKKRRPRITRKEKITLITLGTVATVLLIAAIIMVSAMFAAPEDDGLILKGVIAAGVNLGGMTPEEAADALEKATADTYTKLDMTVTVLDNQITLSPADTGASLDIQAVVEDAYNYGRTGSAAERNQAKNHALTNSVIIPITSHLNLDTLYIRTQIIKLGSQFSSTLTQPTITLTGTKPSMDVAKPNTDTVYQTMSIYVGTAEYGLDTDKLYEQVLEYYNMNIFQVVGACTVVAPDSLEDQLLTYYQDLCVEPVDAQIDPVTYEVTPETYGYGFNLDAVKEQIASAAYGTTIDIPLRFLTPNITEELLSSTLFKDVMGDFESELGAEAAWNSNVMVACQRLNGLILKSGDAFSFNQILGELTDTNGYQVAMAYVDTKATMVMGGGVAHAASVLYNSVLEAELELLEHHNHTYAVNFIATGRDAYVDGITKDFRFRNDRPDPIRIKAEVVDGKIKISIEGTDTRDYTVTVKEQITKTILPGNLYNIMLATNPGGYKDGQELVAGANGYHVTLTAYHYSKTDGRLLEQVELGQYTYDAQDAVVVKLQVPTTPPASSEPTVPATGSPSSTPTEPEYTEPTPSEPEASEPETSEPETSEPETSEPETSEPASTEETNPEVPTP